MATGSPPEWKEVTDPKAWLAVAHPTRMRILGQLQGRDAARAKDLAEALGEPANSISFHLRQLARFGYIEPDNTRRDDRRERWWRTTVRHGFRMRSEAKDSDAARKVIDLMAQQSRDQLDLWFEAVRLPDEVWDRRLGTMNFDLHLFLTEEERQRFSQELGDVLERWIDHSRSTPNEEGREEYVVFGYGLPQWAYDEALRRRTSGSPSSLKPTSMSDNGSD